MNNFYRSYPINVSDDPQKPKVIWRKYVNQQHRNKAKAYRRNRVVAGKQDNQPRPKRARYYRDKGRKINS